MKLRWQFQHLAGIPAPDRPFEQAAILIKINDVSQPLGAGRTGNDNYIRHVARPYTATDGQLDPLQQPAVAPFILKPVYRNLWQTTLGVPTTTSPADRNLPHHQTLRFQWVVAVHVQGKPHVTTDLTASCVR